MLQICKAGVARMRKIWFSRHGESEYNMFAKIGGDSNISPHGQVYAKLLPDLMVDRVPLVRTSTSCECRSAILTGTTEASIFVCWDAQTYPVCLLEVPTQWLSGQGTSAIVCWCFTSGSWPEHTHVGTSKSASSVCTYAGIVPVPSNLRSTCIGT